MGMLVYPNPAGSVVTVELTGCDEGKSYEGSIYDLQGKQVQSFVLEGLRSEVNTEGLATGTYILKVYDPQKTIATTTVSILK